jgi:hypothetical protein
MVAVIEQAGSSLDSVHWKVQQVTNPKTEMSK